MPSSIIKFGFSGGVLSPRLHFRSDLKKFDLAAAEARNYFIEYTGGASSRPGTEFIDYIQDDDEPARIVEFSFNRNISNTYGILFSKSRIRFLQDGAYVLESAQTITSVSNPTVTKNSHGYLDGDWVKIAGNTYEVANKTTNTFELLTPYGVAVDVSTFAGLSVARIYTIASPYATADLPYLTFSQYRDTLEIDSVSYPSKALVRVSNTNWTLNNVAFDGNNVPPTSVVITPSTSGSAGAVYAVTAVDFNGRESYVAGTGIQINRSMVNFTVTAGSALITWTAPAGNNVAFYRIYRSLVLISGTEAHFGMQLGYIGRSTVPRFTDNNIIADFTQSPPVFDLPIKGGQMYDVRVAAGGSGYSDAVVLTAPGTGQDWSGKAVVVGGAIVGVRVLNPGFGYTASPSTITVSGGGGSGASVQGYPTPVAGNDPACSAMIQQRRVRAGTNNYPGTIFGSRIADPNNYYSSPLGLATDPYSLSLDSEQLTPIRYILPYPEGMFLFQETGVTQVRGLDDGVIKVGSAKAQQITEEGCARIPPIKIGRDYIYLNAAQTAVFNLAPSNLPTYYVPNDVSVFSEHYFPPENPIVSWTWAKAPHKLLWAARADGSMISMTYVSEQDVMAWSNHTTRGFVEDVESVLENNIDRTYLIVRRSIGGVERRYIERMALRRETTPDDMWSVDCGLRTPLIYPASSITLRDSADTNGLTPVPPTGSVVVSASSAVFVVGDVGKVFRLGTARGIVTQFIDSQHLMVALNRVLDYDSSDYDNLSEKVWAAGSWSLNSTFSFVTGLDHLEGRTVQILGDGNILDEKVVTNGRVNLSRDCSYVVAGLGFTGVLRTLPITASDTVVENKRKNVRAVAVRLYNSRGLEFGDEAGDQLFPINNRAEDGVVTAPVFKNGIYEVSIASSFELDGSILIKKEGPVSATVLGYVLDTEIER